MVKAPHPHPLNRMKVAPVRVYGPEKYIDTYACLDTAAGDCICTRELMEELNLKGEPRQTAIMSATGTTQMSTAHYLTLAIQGYRTKEIFKIDAIALAKMTDLSEHIPSQADIDRHPHMRGLKIPNHKRKKVDILICIGESVLQHSFDTRIAPAGQLWATCTGLGWVVHGRDSDPNCSENVPSPLVPVNSVQPVRQPCQRPPPEGECEILEKVRKTFALDYSEPQHVQKKLLSRTGQLMLQRQQETFRIVDGRCEVGKLWRKSPQTLPNNRWMAEQSLRRLGRRLIANPGLLEQYQVFIAKMMDNNQAEIPAESLGSQPGFFLLHHPVLEKFRVVFNGASRYKGQCLNDFLDKGPEHTSSLLGVMLRFCKDKYAVSADIKGMFYNVSIPESDRDFMRFLWFEGGDPSKGIIEYRLTHQVPGLTDSPSNACFALRQLAERNPAGVSEATCKATNENFYMDDLCASGPDQKEMCRLSNEMPRILKPGGFHITKWVANDPNLIAGIPEEDRRPGTLHKILGIMWDTEVDELKIKFDPPTQPPSRRGILSYVMTPFDPRGLALPYLLDMKLLVQGMFGKGWTWDTELTDEPRDAWTKWVAELPALKGFSYQRPLIPEPGYDAIYLCIFTDASEKGYAASVYIVCEYATYSTARFVMGKVRVAPKQKLITIPRLELLGAVVGVEAATTVKAELGIEFSEVHFWTDSTTVLHWVTNPDLQLKAFVANRVAKVIEGSKELCATWNYVPTKENPADIGSRGLRPSDTEGIKPWLEGPPWLRTGKDTWRLGTGNLTAQPTIKDLEVKKINAIHLEPKASKLSSPPLQNLFQRYSSLGQLKTTTAWLLRLQKLRKTKSKQGLSAGGRLAAVEMEQAEMELVRSAQWSCFPTLMLALSAQPPLTDKDLLTVAKNQQKNMRELAPYMDEYGLLRVGGRLQRAGFAYEKTHPLILPRRHELTGLLVQHYHQKSLHRGYNYILAQLRERYWVIGGTGTTRHYLSTCVRCRHNRAPAGSQQMAPLPASRFAVGHPPFTYTAVDYFGPLTVKVTRRITAKRWGCLMTCLTTRAVHLEVAHHLNTDSFLLAFRRFVSRFPGVKEMLSDNGGNFVAADKELKTEFAQNISLEDLARGLRKDDSVEFRWKFNPPAASHQGGVFERMIGLVRSCLRCTMEDVSYRTPDDEGLLTMLKEIEGILNSRPLLPAGLDADSYDVLTPAQILQPGTPAVPQALREYTTSDALRRGYRATQWHVDEFWRRFSSGYIPLLQKRAKWLKPHRNFRVGDIVLIQDKDAPRYQWRKAWVSEVHPNKADGLVRRVTLQPVRREATLKPAKKERPLVRDVRYICLLEASPELEVQRTRGPEFSAHNDGGGK